MKRVLALVVAMLFLNGCSSLPGEERAFAVALGVETTDDGWQVSARLPTYQAEGGYMTLSASGNSLGDAMALLNATAPMELHYGQLRLLLFSAELAQSDDFPELLRVLSSRGEVRPQATLAVTQSSVRQVVDALEPATGSRLSKSLETLLEARQRLGVIPQTTLEAYQRLGQRQQAVLLNISLPLADNQPGLDTSAGMQNAQGGGKVQLAGGWLLGRSGGAKGQVTAMEMQLLSLLAGQLHQGTLSLPEGTTTLLNTSSSIRLMGETVCCTIHLRYSASSFSEEGIEAALTQHLQALAAKLAAADCDALGLARKGMTGSLTMKDWQDKQWRYPALTWQFSIQAERGA